MVPQHVRIFLSHLRVSPVNTFFSLHLSCCLFFCLILTTHSKAMFNTDNRVINRTVEKEEGRKQNKTVLHGIWSKYPLYNSTTNLTKAKELWAAVIQAAHAWNEVAFHAGQTATRARAPLARELTFLASTGLIDINSSQALAMWQMVWCSLFHPWSGEREENQSWKYHLASNIHRNMSGIPWSDYSELY